MVQNSYFCKDSYLNVYELDSKKSNISTQLIYGEKFRIIGKKKDFFKIRTDFDNYLGYIKINKFNKIRYFLYFSPKWSWGRLDRLKILS